MIPLLPRHRHRHLQAADVVFLDDCVGLVFPVFNRDLSTLYESDNGDGRGRERDSRADEDDVMALRFPMRNLMIHDDSDLSSSSSLLSSGGDDLEGIPPGSYCVWTPNSPKASPGRPKKSNSTGLLSKQSKLVVVRESSMTIEEKGGGSVLVEFFLSQGCATSPAAELAVSRLGQGDFQLEMPVVVLAFFQFVCYP